MRFNTSQSIRRGLTLAEALIAMAIIILIAGIFIPSILRAREAARKCQCNSHLKQRGLGLHNYRDTYTTFPPGYILSQNGPYQGWGWQVLLQPFSDDISYYNSLNINAGLQTEYVLAHVNPIKHYLRCPSDFGPPRVRHAYVVSQDVQNGVVTAATIDAPDLLARSNYFAVAGYLQAKAGGIKHDASGEPLTTGPHLNSGSLGNVGTSTSPDRQYCDTTNFGGIFGQNSGTRTDQITDGTSNVIALGERATPANHKQNAIGHGTGVGVPDCTTAAGLAMTLGDTSIKMNSAMNRQAETTGFGSRHSGGAYFLFADGNVKFLSDKISMDVYRDFSTISDGRKLRNFD